MKKQNKILKRVLAAAMVLSVAAASGGSTCLSVFWGTNTVVSAAENQTYGDFDYEVNEDGTVTITSYNGSDEEVTVPNKIDGKSVRKIGESAFYDSQNLKYVTIANGITLIDEMAFYYCDDLKSVTIPKSVTSIGDQAFGCCRSLKNIDIDKANAVYSSEDGVVFSKDRTKLLICPGGKTGEYTIPDSVRVINDNAFRSCNDLTEITIPQGVTKIGENAFLFCSELKSIDIPDGVTSIGDAAFYGCSKLTSVKLPDGITSIGYETFMACTKLKIINIPDSVTSIGEDAFWYCEELTTIIIPAGVTEIGDDAFRRCNNLTIYCEKGSYAETYAKENNIASSDHVPEAAINTVKVELYAMNTWAEEYISIPSDYAQSFQIEVTGASSVQYEKADSYRSPVKISDSGLIEPNYKTDYYYYWTDEDGQDWITMTTDYELEDKTYDKAEKYCYFGTENVEVYAGGKVFNVEVTVKDYADYYANQVMDDYLAENITADMTTEEKLEKIAKFVADRDYSIDYQGYTGLIISGGGDCWASTNTIITMARKLGLRAWGRYAGDDAGAGSGHRNAMVCDGTDYYLVEAGYGGTAPRPYYVQKRDTLFHYRYNNEYDGYEIYSYDEEEVPDVLEIPSSIDGVDVVSIGEDFIYNRFGAVKKVILPSTIKNIGEAAFCSCQYLESINIPDSVENISPMAFTDCQSLKNIDASGRYTYKNGVLYKDNEILVAAPNAAAVSIPSNIKEIADYAFYYNPNLESVVIPESVKSIGRAAFAYCSALKNVEIQGSGLEKLSSYVFVNSDELKYIVLPESVKEIGEDISRGVSDFTIIGTKGSVAEEYAASSGLNFLDVNGSSALYISLDKSEITLTEGDSTQLILTVFPSTVTENIQWSSSDSKVTSVSNGRITAQSAGTATITAKTSSGKTASVNVTVYTPLVNNTTISKTNFKAGQAVTIKGAAAGGSEDYEYEFYYKRSTASTWIKFGSSATATFKPSSPGTFDIRVYVKDSAGTSAVKNFTLTAEGLVNDSMVSKTNFKVGEAVTIKGAASGSTGSYTYEFYYKRSTASTWTKFGSAAIATFKPSSAGTFNIKVIAKDSAGASAVKNFTLTAFTALINNTTVSKTNFKVGEAVTIKGAATGGSGNYQYEFYYKRSTASTWTKFGSATTATFKPSSAGTFNIRVYAKDSVGNSSVKNFTLTAFTALVNNTTVSKTNFKVGEAVTVKGAAAGGNGDYRYEFYYKRTTSDKWVRFGSAATATFKPSSAGSFNIRVYAKDSAGNASVKNFTVTATKAQ